MLCSNNGPVEIQTMDRSDLLICTLHYFFCEKPMSSDSLGKMDYNESKEVCMYLFGSYFFTKFLINKLKEHPNCFYFFAKMSLSYAKCFGLRDQSIYYK